MASLQPKAPAIPPVAASDHRPFWSVMIPVFNRTTYLEPALRSVLEQDPGPDQMQIEVVDNGSDQVDIRPFVQRIAGDRVRFHRNSRNLGIFGNLNMCITRAQGHWVHLLHDDDMVRPGFYRELRKGVQDRPEVGAAFCRYAIIDGQDRRIGISAVQRETPGIIDRWIERIVKTMCIRFPAIVVRRSVFEEMGGFSPEFGGSACDYEMWVRLACRYPFWFEPQVLACSRDHPGTESSKLFRSGEPIAGGRQAIEVFKDYLPPGAARVLVSQARDRLATYALDSAAHLFAAGHYASALVFIREALLTSQSPVIVRALETGLFHRFQPFAHTALQRIADFRQSPQNAEFLKDVRAIRKYLAEQWINVPPEFIEQVFPQELGLLHQAILQSGLLIHPLTPEEDEFLSRIITSPGKPLDHPQNAGRRLASELYKRPA